MSLKAYEEGKWQGRVSGKVFFYVVAALWAIAYAMARFTFLGQNKEATLQLLMEGKAATPFQYRVLIPQFVDFVDKSAEFFGIHFDYLYSYISVEVVASFLIIIMLQRYLFLLLGQKNRSYWFSVLLFPLLVFNYVIPKNYAVFYPWDTPAVLIMLLGLMQLYQRKWVGYYLVFAIGAWNRETVCFLTIAYLITSLGRDNLRTILTHCVAQLLLWSVVKAILYSMYHDNSGAGLFQRYHTGTLSTHLSTNLEALLNPTLLLLVFSSFGFIWLFVIVRYSKIQDPFVRRALHVVWPYILGMMWVANIDEIRVWGELFPYVAPAFALAWTADKTIRS